MDFSRGNVPFALPTENRNYYGSVIGSGVPILDQDLNLQQRIAADRVATLIQTLTSSGWITSGTFHSFGSNTFKINTSEFILAGFRCYWDGCFTSDNKLTFVDAELASARYDLVWIELWLEELDQNDTIYKYGNVDYYGTNYTNDIVDSAVGLACTHRVQVRYRTRITKNAEQVSAATVFARGARTSEGTVNFTYDASNDYYVADTSDTSYSITDGKVYALPLCKVLRPAGVSIITSGNVSNLRSTTSFAKATGTVYDELHVVTAAEEASRVVTVPFTYQVGNNRLEVYNNGLVLRVVETIGAITYGDFTETNATSVTFEPGVIVEGDVLRFRTALISYGDDTNNLTQIARDVFGDGYQLNNDGARSTRTIGTFTAGDTTPDISNRRLWETNNAVATTITDLDGGRCDDIRIIKFGDNNTTIQSGATIRLQGGVNFLGATDTMLTLILDDGDVWNELYRSIN